MKLTNYNNSVQDRYNPFSLMDKLIEREFSPYYWGDTSRTGDTVRFKESDELTVEIDLPGVSKENTKVTVEGRVISIEGNRKVIHKGGIQEETFSRSVKVGESYNIDKIKAEQKDGVLTLYVPRNKVENGGKKIITIE